MLIRIESGCRRIFGGMNEWIYEHEDNTGRHKYFFTSSFAPKIGDSIDTIEHVLIPLVGYIINNDPGMQKTDYSDEWPEPYKG